MRTDTMLVYKEPFLAFAPELAYESFPEGRLVYIFRDGRDVADSLVRTFDVLSDRKLADLETNEAVIGKRIGDRYVPWWVAADDSRAFLASSQYVRAIWMWREMVRRCNDFLTRPDVVASGRVLQVRYEDLIDDPRAQGAAIVKHLGRELTPKIEKRLQTAHAQSIGIHKTREPSEIRAAEQVAGTELEQLGYRLSSIRE
jgi:hypothetical protein